jgi:hypothetical protein
MRPVKTTDGHASGWTLQKGKDGRNYISADDLGFWVEEALAVPLTDQNRKDLLDILYERVKDIAEKVVLE